MEATRDALSIERFELSDAIAAFDWDLTSIQALHLRLSKAMSHDVEWLLGPQEQKAEVA